MGLGAWLGGWEGAAELEAERQPACPGRPPLPRSPLASAAPASLEKPAAQETAGGAQTAAPPRPPPPPPPAPPPRPPNPPEGAVAARVAPPADSPHTCGRTIYNSAPPPGPSAGAGCASELIVPGISAPLTAGGDKFSLRKLGEHFPKLHVPGTAARNPSALPAASRRRGCRAPGRDGGDGRDRGRRRGGGGWPPAWRDERARRRGWPGPEQVLGVERPRGGLGPFGGERQRCKRVANGNARKSLCPWGSALRRGGRRPPPVRF